MKRLSMKYTRLRLHWPGRLICVSAAMLFALSAQVQADILWANTSSGAIQMWYMNGEKVAGRATVLGETGSAERIGPPWSIVGTGEFNQDGKADILWANSSTGAIQIWYMNREKVAARATVLGETGSAERIGPPWSIVGIGEFNRDGKADILWANSSTGAIQIWFMNGEKVAGRANVLGETGSAERIGPPWSIVGTGDFNRDGKADILWANSSTGAIQIWFMNGEKVAGRATVLGETGSAERIGPPWSIVETNDLNGDRGADILWHNSSTNETQIWFMNGNRVSGRRTVLGENGSALLVGLPWSIVGTGVFNKPDLPVSKPDLPVRKPDLPETVTLDSGSITSGLPIGGSAKLVMSRSGQFTFSGHMHNSGALGIDFLVTFVVMTPSGIAYTVQYKGDTGGTFTSGSRNDDWTISGFNEGIRDKWAEASQARLTWTMHANDTLTGQIGKALEDALQEALKAVGKAAVTALIALL
jgi:VCBS repeat protein